MTKEYQLEVEYIGEKNLEEIFLELILIKINLKG